MPSGDTNELSEAALALDRELRRFDELAEQAARQKLNTEKNLERATEALTRAAETQDGSTRTCSGWAPPARSRSPMPGR